MVVRLESGKLNVRWRGTRISIMIQYIVNMLYFSWLITISGIDVKNM